MFVMTCLGDWNRIPSVLTSVEFVRRSCFDTKACLDHEGLHTWFVRFVALFVMFVRVDLTIVEPCTTRGRIISLHT
jgi:hypothetical protein